MNLREIKADALARLKRTPIIIADVDKPLPDMPTAADYGLTQKEWIALWAPPVARGCGR